MSSTNMNAKSATDGSKSNGNSGNSVNHSVLPLYDSPCDDVTHWICKLSKETNRDDT
jgi:hypothetical protein